MHFFSFRLAQDRCKGILLEEQQGQVHWRPPRVTQKIAFQSLRMFHMIGLDLE